MPGQPTKRSLHGRSSSASTPRRFGDGVQNNNKKDNRCINDRGHINLVTCEDSGVSLNERLHG